MNMFKRRKKHTDDEEMTQKQIEEEKIKEYSRKSFQEMFPIKDVVNGCVIDDNDIRYPVIVLGSIDYELMSYDQKEEFVKRLETNFIGMNCEQYEILLVPQSYDVKHYNDTNEKELMRISEEKLGLKSKLKRLDKSSKEADYVRKNIAFLDQMEVYIRSQTRFVTGEVHEGNMITKKAYLIPYFPENQEFMELRNQSNSLIEQFRGIGIKCTVATDSEIRGLLYNLLNPLATTNGKIEAYQNVPGIY